MKNARSIYLESTLGRLRSNQVLVEPDDSLSEGLLLGKLDDPVVRVAPHREAVLDAGEQVDLVRQPGLLEDHLGPVALLRGEDGVRLGGGDGERARDGGELGLRDEGGVRCEADVDAVLVVADEVLQTVSFLVPRGLVARGLGKLTLAPKQYATAPIFS